MPLFYSQRMLNPFHGIVNVVEIDGADAVSRDGINWALYIQGGAEPETFTDGTVQQVSLPDIKFGTWSERQGLKRAPVRFVTDYAVLDHKGTELLGAVKSAADEVPFPQRDRYELWLLDHRYDRPLALLQSVCTRGAMRQVEVSRWNPGQAARKAFDSKDWSARDENSTCHADELSRLINEAAGTEATARWFLRGADGTGVELSANGSADGSEGLRLRYADFPELLIRERWEVPEVSLLVRDFLAWQAPWLLALQGLSRDTRRRLEAEACCQALLVDQLCATYPEVVDAALINKLRVEAALRRANGVTETTEDNSQTTFFITGN